MTMATPGSRKPAAMLFQGTGMVSPVQIMLQFLAHTPQSGDEERNNADEEDPRA